jgi:iron complex outermembrane receptor protein
VFCDAEEEVLQLKQRIGRDLISLFIWLCWFVIEPVDAEEDNPCIGAITTDSPRVSEVQRFPTNIGAWLAQEIQPPEVEPIQITRVRLNSTVNGLNVTLDIRTGQLQQLTPTQDGKTWSVDIPNAVLALPDGKQFQADQPASGIAAVTVTQPNDNTVRVSITGSDDLPVVEIKPDQQGLIISTTPSELEEELVVTAEKRPENPQNVPISLTVLPRQDIEDAQINSIRDVAANTPNFFTTLGDRGFNFQSIRGLSNSNFLVRDTLGVYIDDVPYENIHQFLPGLLPDLERVEMLRGPQNTLYGRSSQAGVVNVISRPPSNQPEFSIGGGYGNFNQRDVQFSVGGPAIRDKLALRLSGAYNARDGFTKDTLLDEDANDQSSLYGRASLLWTPTQELSVAFNANVASNQDGDSTFVPIDQDDPFQTERNIPGSLDVSINTQSLKVAYEGSAVNVTAITARNDTNLNYRADTDYTADDLARSAARIPSTIWSQEIRVQSPNSAERFRWLLGGYYQSRSLDIFESATFTAEGGALFGVPAGETDRTGLYDQRTFALFGQADVKPIAPLTLTFGLRYENNREELDRSRIFNFEDGTTTTGLAVTGSTIEDDIVLPKFAIAYRFNPTLTTYASITRGYKPGTQNYRAEEPALLVIQPETSWNYEIGLKSSWLQERLSANLGFFWHNIRDYQVLVVDETGFLGTTANADVETRGVELELRAKPLNGLDIIAGFGYTDATFSNYTNPLSGESFKGNQLTYAPEFTYNLAVQYRSSIGVLGRVELQGLGTYFFDDANTLKQDPFALVNARIGYEAKNYQIYFFVNNLLDERYVTAAFFAGLPDALASFGDLRTFGFQIRAGF